MLNKIQSKTYVTPIGINRQLIKTESGMNHLSAKLHYHGYDHEFIKSLKHNWRFDCLTPVQIYTIMSINVNERK